NKGIPGAVDDLGSDDRHTFLDVDPAVRRTVTCIFECPILHLMGEKDSTNRQVSDKLTRQSSLRPSSAVLSKEGRGPTDCVKVVADNHLVKTLWEIFV
ncbi:hypothetical protein HAX54_036165, partial [Datura stramonium]|nr:hypothetical protein [Datura stramonium]